MPVVLIVSDFLDGVSRWLVFKNTYYCGLQIEAMFPVPVDPSEVLAPEGIFPISSSNDQPWTNQEY